MEKSYWNDNGKFQKQQEHLWERYVPECGGCSDRHAEMFRLISRLYYDVYNNGACNVIFDGHDDMKLAGSSLRIIADAIGERAYTKLVEAVDELSYTDYPTDDEWADIYKALEPATDTVIEYAWNELEGGPINEFTTETK